MESPTDRPTVTVRAPSAASPLSAAAEERVREIVQEELSVLIARLLQRALVRSK